MERQFASREQWMQLAGKNPISNNTEAKAKGNPISRRQARSCAWHGAAARARAPRGGADQPLPSPSRPPARPASPPSPRSGIDSDCHHPPPPSCSRMLYIPVRTATAMDNDPSIHLSLCLRVSDPRQASYGGQRTEQGGAVKPGRQDGARHRRKQRDRVSTHTTRRASVLLQS